MLLSDVLMEILLEAKDRKQGHIRPQVKEAIKNCIENRWLLQFYYEGDKETAPGSRYAEVYLWGDRKGTGTEQIRAWQYAGKTTSWNPGWATFRLDRIKNTAPITTKTFDKPRPLYNPDDKHMSGIKMRVSFDNNNGNKHKNMPSRKPKPGGDKNKNSVSRLKNRE